MVALTLASMGMVLGLSGETWTAIGAVAGIGAFALMVLDAWEGPSADRTPSVHSTKDGRWQCPPEVTLLCNRAGLTNSEIAAAVGVADSTVRAWRAGRQRPSPPHRQRLLELCATATRLLAEGETPTMMRLVGTPEHGPGEP
jgi:DNA-binding transcriptional regulator YiaG